MENIMKALGDNAKFYPNYLANHVAIDFRFHLNNGIGRLVEENAELREGLKNLVASASENEEQLNDVLMCGDYGESEALCKARQLLNK